MASPLSALSGILSSGIATIESTYAAHGIVFPSLDEPFQPGPLDMDTKLLETIDLVIAAASHLIALVKPAPRTILESSFSVSYHNTLMSVLAFDRLHKFHLPSSLGLVVSADIPEILREAGSQVFVCVQSKVYFAYGMWPQGLHVKDIGDKCGADPQKMGN
jgi:hypothetical protein